MEKIIEIKNLHKNFDSLEVLKGINLDIKTGSVVAIIGSSGSGKSTLLRCINLLEQPTSGEILFNGVNINEPKVNIDKVRQEIGLVFQSFNLFENMNVIQNCMIAQTKVLKRDKQEARKIATEYLNQVGMSDFIEADTRQLSGGQKQRVAIARALAMENELIIFDESTSMLDPLGTKEVIQTIKDLKEKQNKTIIVITHNLEEAVFADRVMVINEGKVIVSDTPQEVFKNTPLLEACGLVTLEGIEILDEIKKSNLKNKDQICEALWELTFKM